MMRSQITDAERERYERTLQGLDQAIYELTWLGKFFGKYGALALEDARCHYLLLLDRRADALSTSSSTYYAAAGSMRASARNYSFVLRLITLAQAKYLMVLARADASPNNKALMYRLAADIATSQGEYGRAERDIARALELRLSLGPETVIRILRTQATLEETRGNHVKAEMIRREIHQISLAHALPGQDQKNKAGL